MFCNYGNSQNRRKKLNFSQIFMKALRQEIRERSRLLKAPDEQLARAAQHYRQALTDDSGSLVDIGFELGCTHVLQCALSPAVIRRLWMANDAETLRAIILEVHRSREQT